MSISQALTTLLVVLVCVCVNSLDLRKGGTVPPPHAPEQPHADVPLPRSPSMEVIVPDEELPTAGEIRAVTHVSGLTGLKQRVLKLQLPESVMTGVHCSTTGVQKYVGPTMMSKKMHAWLSRGDIQSYETPTPENFFSALGNGQTLGGRRARYTWCVRHDGKFYLTETGTSRRDDTMSKHAVLCSQQDVCGAGEATVYDDASGHILVLDNNSGTYRPTMQQVNSIAQVLTVSVRDGHGDGLPVVATTPFIDTELGWYCEFYRGTDAPDWHSRCQTKFFSRGPLLVWGRDKMPSIHMFSVGKKLRRNPSAGGP
eukprot:GFYU01008689.1.p1 GENE.GFYU01008689.1~~GFYU01008689.1.p1  ORF type:complete len:312 (+),score=40.05 GFYU01008689.1:104-1039(+)